MQWEFLPVSEACQFMWNTECARDFEFFDFVEMIELVKKNSFYGLIFEDQLLALVRIQWVVQPVSCYFDLWTEPALRRSRKQYNFNYMIMQSLFDLFTKQLKTKRVIAICRSKNLARLCKRFGADEVFKLDNLYYKNGDAYICYWRNDLNGS